MAGAAKQRANQERELQARMRPGGSSSGGTSSKASQSVRSSASASASVAASQRSTTSHRSNLDGNRDPDGGATRNPNTSRPAISDNMGRSLDLGTIGFSRISGVDAPAGLATRPAPSTLGTATQMGLNTFDVKLPSSATKVYQFEVLVGNGAEKRGLIDKVWSSKAVRQALGSGWIFDGALPLKLPRGLPFTDIYQATVSRGQ